MKLGNILNTVIFIQNVLDFEKLDVGNWLLSVHSERIMRSEALEGVVPAVMVEEFACQFYVYLDRII